MSTQQQHKAPAPPSPQPPVAANGTLTPSDREGAVEFVAISRSVHVYRPRKDRKAGPPDAGILSPVKAGTGAATPSAVVIMGWMDAPLRIVSKYAAPYAVLFPRATIIIKLSTGIAFMAGKEAREAALKGVLKVLEEVQASSEARGLLQVQVADLKKSSNQAGLRLDVDSQNRLQDESDRDGDGQTGSPSPAGGILVHSFSDGGANNLSQLLRLFPGRNVPPPQAIIFDCSPGKSTARSASTAFSLPLARRPYVRLIVRSAIYLFLRVVYVLKMIIGSKTWSELLRRHLNNPASWTWSNAEPEQKSRKLPPRLYLYSKADALIDYRAVEEHAQEAAKLQGLPGPLTIADLKTKKSKPDAGVVVLRRWEDAKHCDLGRADFDGYWTAVRSFLEAAL